MGNLTIDQILADRHKDENPEIYSMDKEASAQPPKSSPFSDEEIEKMASHLGSAEIATPVQGDNFNERLAAALILNDSISSIVKEAQEQGEFEVEEAPELSEEEIKTASFIQKAVDAGYSHQEALDFVEKKAGLSQSTMKNIGKGALAAAGLGTAGVLGKEYGESQTEEKAIRAMKKIVPKVFQAGQRAERRRNRGY